MFPWWQVSRGVEDMHACGGKEKGLEVRACSQEVESKDGIVSVN